MRFSTDVIPERDRASMLCDFYGPLVARLDIEPVPGGTLHFEIAPVPYRTTISTLAFSAIRARRTRALTADGNDNCMICALHSPGNTIEYRGREVVPGEGEGTLMSPAEAFACATVDGIARGMSISAPRKVLAASVLQLEDGFGQPVRSSEALRLLIGYVGLLEHDDFAGDPRAAPAGRDACARSHRARARRLARRRRDRERSRTARGAAQRHQDDICASLDDPNLSLRTLAARHQVTPRYVQALFESEGATFSQFLLNARLARVHRSLRDPLQDARAIGTIAYEAGFGDLSYFNRAFRRRYGATPSDIRETDR
jgi:AraC-like DNA-binding protein